MKDLLFRSGRWLRTSLLASLLTAPLLTTGASLYPVTLGWSIPDDDLSGVASTVNVASDIGSISSVQVTLSVHSGYAGDYYAYLTHDGVIAVLLNRTARSQIDPFGLSSSGIAVVFDDLALADIHSCQTSLAPTGAGYTHWQPDARNVLPDVAESDSPRTAFLSAFNGLSAKGDWTLFIADASPVGTGIIDGWSLNLNGPRIPVPDCGMTWILLFLGMVAVSSVRLLERRALHTVGQ